MDDSASSAKKPLRTSSNKVRDLYNTYMKNQPESRRGEDMNDAETEQMATEEEIQIQDETIEVKSQAEPVESQAETEPDKLSEAIKERDELKDQLKRLAAELENFRRRSLKEKRELIDYANERLLFDMLPLLDDFSAAIEAGKQNTDYEALLKGFDLIFQKANKLFENAGVKLMENPVGKPFDVNFHEAMMHIPSEVPEDYVVQVVQPGYMMNEKVLRHAKVITSAGEPKE